MDSYFESLPRFYGAQFNEMTTNARSISVLPREKIIIAVPVHSSELTLIHLIEAFRHQTIDERLFRIVIFLNRSPQDPGFEHLVKQINEAKRNSGLQISFFKKIFNKRETIGFIRKMLVDTVLLASKNPGLIVVNTDCDTYAVEETYLREHLEAFSVNKKLVRYGDFLRVYPSWVETLGVFKLLVRFYGLLEQAYNDLPLPFPMRTQGTDLVFSAEIYAAVGGYDASLAIAEDITLSYDISRKFSKKIFERNKAKLYYSLRRVSRAYVRSVPFFAAWSDFSRAHSFRAKDEHAMIKRLKEIDAKTDFSYFQKEITLCFNYWLVHRIVWYLESYVFNGQAEKDSVEQTKVRAAALRICVAIFKKALNTMGYSFKVFPYPIDGYLTAVKQHAHSRKTKKPIA